MPVADEVQAIQTAAVHRDPECHGACSTAGTLLECPAIAMCIWRDPSSESRDQHFQWAASHG